MNSEAPVTHFCCTVYTRRSTHDTPSLYSFSRFFFFLHFLLSISWIWVTLHCLNKGANNRGFSRNEQRKETREKLGKLHIFPNYSFFANFPVCNLAQLSTSLLKIASASLQIAAACAADALLHSSLIHHACELARTEPWRHFFKSLPNKPFWINCVRCILRLALSSKRWPTA